MSSSSVLGKVFDVGIPFLLRGVTPLHPGSGSRVSGLADLPVQREAGTDMPVIYGSSLKGALRSWARVKGMDEERIREIFGPPPGEGDKGMGKAAFLDARLLFLPVRSFKGVYGWITSPFLLRRFKQDMRLVSELSKGSRKMELSVPEFSLKENLGVGSPENLLKFELGGREVVVLEDHMLDFRGEKMEFISALGELGNELKDRLVVVHDDTFRRLMRRAMQITPHIKIKEDTGTAENLWFQEDLPVETVFYSIVFSPADLQEEIEEKLLKGLIHVGGDITTGLGFARVYLI